MTDNDRFETKEERRLEDRYLAIAEAKRLLAMERETQGELRPVFDRDLVYRLVQHLEWQSESELTDRSRARP